MYAITGITGKVGGEMARRLLAKGSSVRAVLRDARKAAPWAAAGCEVALASMEDAEGLTAAFRGVEGAFVLLPPVFDPEPGYPEARRVIEAVATALAAARPCKVVSLSTIGADAAEDNLLTQHTLLERRLRELDLPVTFLRPGWFMENAAWDVAAARDEGLLRSFLQPRGRAIPMVATRDVGATAARLIQEEWSGARVVELEGPSRVSPNDLAAAFSEVLGRDVRVESVPRESWEPLFRSQGARNPEPRIRMLDGFNEGWIGFGGRKASTVKGATPLIEVVRALVAAEAS